MKRFIILLLFVFSLALQARASHFLGGEITYKVIGKDKYIVYATLYRDCNGAPLHDTNIAVFDSAGKKILQSTKASRIGGFEVTPVSNTCTKCVKNKLNFDFGNTQCTSFAYGIEQFVYEQKIDLSASTSKGCRFTLVWEDCCRSGAITTGASGQNFHLETQLNRCDTTDNSPTFTTPPLSIIPVNKCVYYNLGAIDTDTENGYPDSLSYKLVNPKRFADSFVTWVSPYSYDKPLKFDSFPKINSRWNPPASCSGFHLDPVTGDLFFKPKKVETTLLCIKITSYGHDKWGNPYPKTYVNLELGPIITKNVNDVPELSGIDGTSQTDTSICAGTTLCFSIYAQDTDKHDTVRLSWNKAIPGASFSIDTTIKKQKGTFCWTPKPSDARSYFYQFAVTARDNHTGAVGQCIRSYRVHVLPPVKDSLLVSVPPCGDKEAGFSVITGKGGLITSYQWYGDDSLSSAASSFTHHYSRAGTYKYYLKAANSSCSQTDSGFVIVYDHIQCRLPGDTAVCEGTSLPVSAVGKTLKPVSILWSTGDTSINIHMVITKDTVLICNMKDSSGCSSADTMKVTAYPAPGRPVITLKGNDTLSASTLSPAYIWYRDSILLPDSAQSISTQRSGSYTVIAVSNKNCVSLISLPYTYTYTYTENAGNTSTFIFPNPTSGIFTISAPSISTGSLQLTDLTGITLLETSFFRSKKLDLHNLQKGIYFLKLWDKQNCISKKIFLQ